MIATASAKPLADVGELVAVEDDVGGTFQPLSSSSSSVVAAAVDTSQTCEYDSDCNHGSCGTYTSRQFPNGTRVCKCDHGWTIQNSAICDYHQKDKITAFCLSLFIGYFGADWFYLADGDALYNFLGCLKFIVGPVILALIFGPCSPKAASGIIGLWWIIFWLVDWIRILTDDFKDGHGVDISSW